MKTKHVMTGFAVMMLAYQAYRVLDYMSSSLVGVSDTVRLIVSVAFLAFSEIGLLIWLHAAQPNATTDAQETTSTVMIWADFIGSMVVGLADLAKHNTMYVIDLSAIDPLLFLAPWLMVVLNIGGYLIYMQNDSEAKLEQAERQLRHEENKLEMEARRAAIREIQANKESIAGKLAPHYYREIHDRVTGRTVARFDRQRKQQAPTAPPAAPNGKARGLLTSFMREDNGHDATYYATTDSAELPDATDGHPNGNSREGV